MLNQKIFLGGEGHNLAGMEFFMRPSEGKTIDYAQKSLYWLGKPKKKFFS